MGSYEGRYKRDEDDRFLVITFNLLSLNTKLKKTYLKMIVNKLLTLDDTDVKTPLV